jgi:hypothetical protein
VINAINAKGDAFFFSTSWRGMKAMRVSVVNWRASDDDVKRALQSVEEVLKSR